MFNRKIEKILNEYYENPLNQNVIITVQDKYVKVLS